MRNTSKKKKINKNYRFSYVESAIEQIYTLYIYYII